MIISGDLSLLQQVFSIPNIMGLLNNNQGLLISDFQEFSLSQMYILIEYTKDYINRQNSALEK